MLTPLASLLRPHSIDDIVGQEHLFGAGRPLRKYLESGHIASMILWGPPGCGKTSIASVISESIDADFYHLSGVLSKKEDLMKILVKAKKNYTEKRATILFLDEIHRWNKAQQDTLLPFVEKGIITLIGATTENPSFTVNNALISRARVYILQPISEEQIVKFLEKNMKTIQEQYPEVVFSPASLHLVASLGDGDLRTTLNLLEAACVLQGSGELTRESILEAGTKPLSYDRDGEEHYNLISAMHKSLRDSDGDAAIYWIGRMLAGGEDPRYIARRMINFASEDVGLADPLAMIMANSVYDICEKMGMPECELPMCKLAYHLAAAPRDNSVYMAMNAMHRDIREYGNLPVPLHLRNAPTALMKEAGYGKGYEYAHNLPEKKSEQEHFPERLKGRKYRN